ncbi:MAG: hypothetical protein JSR26_00970 [Proteobacteria bacterium]|nr:hypothetical protein [Pseudomonadota bacterium]
MSVWKEQLRRSDPIIALLNGLPLPLGTTRFGVCGYGVKSISRRIYVCYYRTALDFYRINDFYNALAHTKKWRFVGNTKIGGGDRVIQFANGEYIISVQYAGEQSLKTWQYSVDIRTK